MWWPITAVTAAVLLIAALIRADRRLNQIFLTELDAPQQQLDAPQQQLDVP